MVFPPAVARDAREVAVETLAGLRTIGRDRLVFIVRQFALALRFPLRHLEILSSGKPVHSALFWSLRYELEVFTGTIFAFTRDLFLGRLNVVLSVLVSAKAETL